MTAADRYRVHPGEAVALHERDPRATAIESAKETGKERTAALSQRLGDLHEDLHAEGRRSLLVVLQAMDAGGRTGRSAACSRA